MPRLTKNDDDRLMMALACGATVESAAASSGVSKRTAFRRMADPEFRRRVQSLRGQIVERTAGMLTAAGGEGVKTLLALMKETVPPPVRLGAARAVIELGMRVRETAELEARIAALEEALGQTT